MGRPNQFPDVSDLTAIADQLAALADGLRSSPDGYDGISISPTSAIEAVGGIGHNQPPSEYSKGETYLVIAKRTYANRRKRDTILGNPSLLGEPAWDILLDLYIAQVESQEVSVSSACIGSASPPTTGLRWLGVLQQEGLIMRISDPSDQRRVLVKLSPVGIECMERYFDQVSRANGNKAGKTKASQPSSFTAFGINPDA